jgi:hypothetical protein
MSSLPLVGKAAVPVIIIFPEVEETATPVDDKVYNKAPRLQPVLVPAWSAPDPVRFMAPVVLLMVTEPVLPKIPSPQPVPYIPCKSPTMSIWPDAEEIELFLMFIP